MRYIRKPVVVEAVTFDELVEIGKAISPNSVINGMPWSFSYQGRPVSHENNDCYIIIIPIGGTLRFNRGDMLVAGARGELYACKVEIFNESYTKAETP